MASTCRYDRNIKWLHSIAHFMSVEDNWITIVYRNEHRMSYVVIWEQLQLLFTFFSLTVWWICVKKRDRRSKEKWMSECRCITYKIIGFCGILIFYIPYIRKFCAENLLWNEVEFIIINLYLNFIVGGILCCLGAFALFLPLLFQSYTLFLAKDTFILYTFVLSN